ncbi:MAG: tRNA pseudouridine(38-40) synthase TruA [Burkholderiaceae bacterium]|nr:tRNA pseudouridine(38-40) synthase TruA [Burkholderiaceae bacterium]
MTEVVARYALTVAYDGSRFSGWQTQPAGTAAQDALERALSTVAGETIRTVCAGRTDAGVHALRQVVHFDSAARRPLSAWVRGTNAHLPAALAVRSATAVADSFHARYGAARRRYRYLLYRSAVRHPLLAQRAGWSFREIDVARMRAAAAALVGEHDFSAFRSAQCQAASPVRRLEELSLCERGPFVVFTFVANAFLHHMIRNIVGSLLAVGEGRRDPPWLAELLAGRDRTLAAATFAPDGLYLDGAQYDEHYGVPSWSAGDDALLEALR